MSARHIDHMHLQVTQYLNAGARQFGFMLRGLQELEKDLKEQNIPCALRGQAQYG